MATYICNLREIIQSYETTNNDDKLTKQTHNQIDAINICDKEIDKFQDDLVFDSSFESGNLFSAYQVRMPFYKCQIFLFKIDRSEYDLILQNDINTQGNTQWFYFSVANTRRKETVRFNIINFCKASPLYLDGIKPVIFSLQQKEKSNQGWKRGGKNIDYYKNDIFRQGNPKNTYHTFSFSYQFEFENDVVYFAYSYPYTYSDLNRYLENLQSNPYTSAILKRKVLCKTIAQNQIDLLTITSSTISQREKRKGIFFMARQHPGEITGSYMIEGVIDFLTSDSFQAEFLRESCIFKIIPMLNVDGVIHGNNRCSLAGSDLNRKWKKPDRKLHPCVYYPLNYIRKFSHQNDIQMIIDFHGHSQKQNAFFYGNFIRSQQEITKIFPLLLSQMDDRISFENSKFQINRMFQSTARISLFRLLRIPHIFTLEASFFGYEDSQGTYHHFSPNDYKQIGKNICLGLFQMMLEERKNEPNLDQQYLQQKFNLKKNPLQNIVQTQPEKNKGNIEKEDTQDDMTNLIEDLTEQLNKINDGQSQSFSGSDSDPSEDELDADMLQKIMPKLKKQKRKSSKHRIIQLKNVINIKQTLGEKNASTSFNNQKRFTSPLVLADFQVKKIPRTRERINRGAIDQQDQETIMNKETNKVENEAQTEETNREFLFVLNQLGATYKLKDHQDQVDQTQNDISRIQQNLNIFYQITNKEFKQTSVQRDEERVHLNQGKTAKYDESSRLLHPQTRASLMRNRKLLNTSLDHYAPVNNNSILGKYQNTSINPFESHKDSICSNVDEIGGAQNLINTSIEELQKQSFQVIGQKLQDPNPKQFPLFQHQQVQTEITIQSIIDFQKENNRQFYQANKVDNNYSTFCIQQKGQNNLQNGVSRQFADQSILKEIEANNNNNQGTATFVNKIRNYINSSITYENKALPNSYIDQFSSIPFKRDITQQVSLAVQSGLNTQNQYINENELVNREWSSGQKNIIYSTQEKDFLNFGQLKNNIESGNSVEEGKKQVKSGSQKYPFKRIENLLQVQKQNDYQMNSKSIQIKNLCDASSHANYINNSNQNHSFQTSFVVSQTIHTKDNQISNLNNSFSIHPPKFIPKPPINPSKQGINSSFNEYGSKQKFEKFSLYLSKNLSDNQTND